ncbi:hypothetical protein V9Z78_24915 [Klebsiella pneumoniae]|nr:MULTISPECIES: hypothetical protein [Klebsiella]KSY34906.1 hypothetical protein APU04_24540 [Klebsiella pneumoniae]MCM6717806.1 hypothetical protein [Klebsiella pneumoniae]MCY0556711.1 hypothetical protein [Klebsiella pneumoniae]MDG0517883.1 hypothetical protein [Klebsiella pneumoniae]RVQ95839.1 hypothetical protein EOL37_27825 [Klebsiella pneumoniae]
MKELDFYEGDVIRNSKGTVNIDGEDYVAELSVVKGDIEIRVFAFRNMVKRKSFDMKSLQTVVFFSGLRYFRLFGMKLMGFSSRHLGSAEVFNDYTYKAKGILHSRLDLNVLVDFQYVNLYSSEIKRWVGNTTKLNKIIACAVNGQSHNHLKDASLIEFERNLDDARQVGVYYSYSYGGLDGIYTFGMSVKPYMKLDIGRLVGLDEIVNSYIELYMFMRFLIGKALDITNVFVYDAEGPFREKVTLYMPEKVGGEFDIHGGTFYPYSSMYHDNSELQFPLAVFDRYFCKEDAEISLLVRKFVNYSMVESVEEQFLGFYRIIERLTFKESHYVNESELLDFLDGIRDDLKCKFPILKMSKFKRVIITANKSKENTERCIINFIESNPDAFIKKMGLDNIDVGDICKVRNKMTHQPFFSLTSDELLYYRNVTKVLCIIMLMIRLGVPYDEIENIAWRKRWWNTLSGSDGSRGDNI